MNDRHAALQWIGYRVDDVYGARVGKIEDVYLDETTEEPVWLLARLGRFGDEHTLIPVTEAVAGAGHVWIPFERRQVKAAPQVSPGSPLAAERDVEIATHYGFGEDRSAAVQGADVSATPSRSGARVLVGR